MNIFFPLGTERGALKGHGFSRATQLPKKDTALAAEGTGMNGKNRPQGLKPSSFSAPQAARLKSCPFKAAQLLVQLGLLTTGAAMLAPSALPAQQAKPWEQIPIPKLHEFKPQQPKRIELKNGIVIFLQEDHELPFVSGAVLIPGGSRDESPAKAGLVGLYGQAWRTSGTAKMDGDALDDLLEAKAAHIETVGDEDSTALSWDSLKGDADQVFALALDLLLHPKFNAEKLELAQQQEATGIVRRNDDESAIAERESAKLVYGVNSPYTRQPELATIGAVTLDDLQAWHDRTVGNGTEGGGKLIVGISGDFDSAAMEAKLRAAFEGLPQAKAEPPRHDVFNGPTPGVYFINKEDVNQSNVEIVGLGTDRRNPDVPTLAIMNEILGGGFASRLFQKVRTELGLAYAVGGGISFAYDHPAQFRAVVITKSPSTVDATKAALAEIAGLTSKPFTQEELARAKDNILNSFLFRYDTRDKVLAESERLEFYGYPANYLETYKAALEKVTVADLEAGAKKYIHPDKLAVLVVGNAAEIKPGLDELNLGPVHPIDITIPQPGRPAGEEKKQ
ncbi:MAG: pitrilysin family protein [Terracidiphilus sp.]